MQIPFEEHARLKAMMSLEFCAKKQGYRCIAGVDEAGRGPLAGPVVAAACVLPEGAFISGIDDSKKLVASKRYEVFQQILTFPGIDYAVGVVDALIIDQINILQATFQAMVAAISGLRQTPDFLLIDGTGMPPISIPGKPIIAGDSLSQSIAAASIIAKQTRDELMSKYHQEWPEYGFNAHKGYGTKQHLLAIEKYGPCPLHRMSFQPLRSLIDNNSSFRVSIF